MAKVIYHGSERIIERPSLGAGNPRNDYGYGFYCTENPELAWEWASAETRDGFVNQYSLDLTDLSILNLNGPGFHILNWLAILLENRSFTLQSPVAVQGHKYILEHFLPDYKYDDILVGYRADDAYFSFSRAFLDNTISLEQLGRAMRLGNLGEQFVLRSSVAFDRLHFVKADPVDSNMFFPRKRARDREARETYFAMMKEEPVAEAKYLVNIINEKWENDDPRLR